MRNATRGMHGRPPGPLGATSCGHSSPATSAASIAGRERRQGLEPAATVGSPCEQHAPSEPAPSAARASSPHRRSPHRRSQCKQRNTSELRRPSVACVDPVGRPSVTPNGLVIATQAGSRCSPAASGHRRPPVPPPAARRGPALQNPSRRDRGMPMASHVNTR